MLDFRRLRYFIVVAEEGHITRAARRLGMQQPPLTQQIQTLERTIGAPLFVRTARGVTLTPAGEALAHDGRAVLASLDAAVERARQIARGQRGSLAVGFTTSAIVHALVPRIIRAFRAQYPSVRLDLSENGAAPLTEALTRRAVKLAVIRQPVSRPPGIGFMELLREELLLVLPIGHRLLQGPEPDAAVPISALADERFILVRQPGAPGIYENVVQACRAAGFEPDIAAEVPHMLTNINLVAAGMGITMVPAAMREVNLRQVAYRPVISPVPLVAPLTLAYVADDSDPLVANFIAVARAEL
jgi:DNA-binding transcriptional LysR family regulator